MNKKIILIVAIVLVFVIVVAVVLLKTNEKVLELTYQTNGGVPYEWQYEIADPSIAEFVKSYEIENKNKGGMVGAPISTNYVFKGLKEGKTTITFRYVSITDGTISKEEKHTIKVDSRKRISLVVIDGDK